MANNYGQQLNSVDGGFPDQLGLVGNLDPAPRGDGLGSMASGSDNPDANFDPYRPLEYDFDFDNFDPFPDNHSNNNYNNHNLLFSDCHVLNIEHQIPSFPETFGQSVDLSPQSLIPSPTPNFDLIPPRDFSFLNNYAPAALPPPQPSAFDLYCNSRISSFGMNALPMPFNHNGTHAQGEAFNNLTGGSSAASGVCPFAPRFNQHQYQHQHQTQNHNRGRNPTPTQPHPSRTGVYYQNNVWLPPSSRTSLAASRPPITPSAQGREPDSDDYIAALISGDFSSPSLPALSSPHRPAGSTVVRRGSANFEPASPLHTNDMPRRGSSSVSRTAASNRPRRSSGASMVDLTSPKAERDGQSPLGVDLTTPMAPPPTRKRPRTTTSPNTTQSNSARPSISTKARPVKPLSSKRNAPLSDDDLFGDFVSTTGKDDEDDDVLDLTGSNEVPAELLKPKMDNRVKLTKFQCSICMDEVAGLTITHCGHLFCSECLHSALHIDHMKKTCPICRQKVDMKAKPGQKQGKNTFFHLELKLMTANRKGKRPVGQ